MASRMSSAFFDAISDYFLERTGRGLVLSSRDLELLIGWQDRGASAQSICRAIDGAIERRGDVPRDLHTIRRAVEDTLDIVESKRPANTSASPQTTIANEDEPFGRAMGRLKEAARPEIAEAYQVARTRLMDAQAAGEDPWSVIYQVEASLVADVFARLGEDERRLIDLEVEGRHGAFLSMMSDEARAATFHEGRADILRARWNLASLTD